MNRWQTSIGLLVLSFGSSAFANFVGNDTSNFNPTASGLDFVTVQSSQTMAPGFLNSGIFINEAGNVLPKTVDGNGNWVSSQNHITFGDWGFAYGVSEHLEADLNLSYLLNQQTDSPYSGAQFSATGLNDVRLGAKYAFQERKPVGLALMTSLNINQAVNNPFVGINSGPTLNLEGIVDGKVEDYLLAFNFGYRLREPGSSIPGSLYQPLPNEIIASIAASRYFPSSDLKIIGEWIASKPTSSVAYVSANAVASEALIGVNYDAFTNTSLHAGFGSQVGGAGLFTPDWRAYVGVNLAFDILHKSQNVTVINPPATVHVHIQKGYQPDDIEAFTNIPFDEVMKTHEFQLRRTVSDSNFTGEKPPFEVIRLDDFDFDFGSAQIRPEYKTLLDHLATYLKGQPELLKVRVEGHTDSVGSKERNRIVSQARADAVKKELVDRGIKEAAVEAVGYGPTRPIADNGNFQGRKQNRRVELRTLRRLTSQPETVKIIKSNEAPTEPTN